MPRRTSLSEFQNSLATAVMRPLGSGDLMRPENHATATAFIKPNDRLTASDRLQIYNQQYWWRILAAFGDDFPGLRAVLGTRRFDRLGVAYLTDHGSRSWNLGHLGSGLLTYLRENPALTHPLNAIALDTAAVEWARIVAFDSAEHPLLDGAKFSRRPPERMTLRLQPYLTLLELRHPVDRLLLRLKRNESTSTSNAISGSLRPRPVRLTGQPTPSPIHLAVHRIDLTVFYKRLEPEAYHLLTALRDGSPLGDACESAFRNSTESPDAISRKITTWFAAWNHFGWLCG